MDKKYKSEQEVFDALDIKKGEELKQDENLRRYVGMSQDIDESVLLTMNQKYDLVKGGIAASANIIEKAYEQALQSNDKSQIKVLDNINYTAKQFAEAAVNPSFSREERDKRAEQAILMADKAITQDSKNKKYNFLSILGVGSLIVGSIIFIGKIAKNIKIK